MVTQTKIFGEPSLDVTGADEAFREWHVRDFMSRHSSMLGLDAQEQPCLRRSEPIGQLEQEDRDECAKCFQLNDILHVFGKWTLMLKSSDRVFMRVGVEIDLLDQIIESLARR